MSTPFFILVVALSRPARVTGLSLPSRSPDGSHDLPKSAKNAKSFTTDFEQWRFGNSTDYPNPVITSALPVWTAPPEIMRRCAESVLTGMPESLAGQPGAGDFFFTDERLTDFLDNADHIYVICMNCTRVLPAKLRRKTSILNGRLSDECLATDVGWTESKQLLHHYRATLAHKLAIADAKARKFKLALVLEEDAVFKEDVRQFDFEPIAALIRDASKEWEVLRLAWFDHESQLSGVCANATVRLCSQWVQRSACTMAGGHLHSSGAYMLPARSYDRFLTQGTLAIDGHVLNQFKQTVLTPPLCNQNHRMAAELFTEDLFVKRCKGA